MRGMVWPDAAAARWSYGHATRGQCAYIWCICLHMCYAMCCAGVESDVDRFMAHYGINPDMYRQQLLSVALAQLQTTPNLAHAAREPLGAAARTLQARDFGGDEDEDRDFGGNEDGRGGGGRGAA